MNTRKIYYIYENVERVVNSIEDRISNSDFLNFLVYGEDGRDWFIKDINEPSEITDFVDEFFVSGFAGDYFKSAGGEHFVRGDVLLINQVVCPDDMSVDEFNALSFSDLVDKVEKGELNEYKLEYVSSFVPINIDKDVYFEFKPTFKGLRFIIKNNVDNDFFDFVGYNGLINCAFDPLRDCSIEELINSKYEYIANSASSFVKNFKNNFQINDSFVVSSDILVKYLDYIKNDLEKSFNNYLDYRKDIENYIEPELDNSIDKKGGFKR